MIFQTCIISRVAYLSSHAFVLNVLNVLNVQGDGHYGYYLGMTTTLYD